MQIMSLCPKGYRLISVQYPAYSSFDRFIRGFDRFIDHIGESSSLGNSTAVNYGVHLFGTVLGGYLALCYAQSRPNRVKSIILCNSFADTEPYSENSPFTTLFNFTPKFLLQSLLLENFPDGLLESKIADSVDFMVYFLEHGLTQSDLSSRLTLNCTAGPVKGRNSDIAVNSDRVTIIDTTDEVALPEELRSNLYDVCLPNAHKAFLKTGGNFPYLSRAEEVNMHIEVHLRRCMDLDQASSSSSSSSGVTNSSFVPTHVVPVEPRQEEKSESDSDV
jgi:maspardin